MKLFIITLIFAAAGILTNCTDSQASVTNHTSQPAPENGAQYKEGKGVVLTEVMAKSINLKTGEVTEEKLTPSITFQLQTVQRGAEASGWLTSAQAVGIHPGMDVEVRLGQSGTTQPLKGRISRIAKSSFVTSGDFEISIETPSILEAGTSVTATVRLKATDGLTAIPKSALLATAEGNFVYAKNADFYVRTPVKIGVTSDEHVEVTEGLYAGDEVVTSPVMSLWLAELQILRGGKACTCGH